MLNKEECLRKIAECRTQEIVITTMGTARPWASVSHHDLDFASVGNAMGHAADFALGIALARPERRVICINGDGSLLMSLGILVTVANLAPKNYVMVVFENGTYEVTGNQPIPGAGNSSLAQMARGAGLEQVYEFSQIDEFEGQIAQILKAEGPVFLSLEVEPGDEDPPMRRADHPAWYLTNTLSEDALALKKKLESSFPT